MFSAVALLVAPVASQPLALSEAFENFRTTFGKSYATSEEAALRFANFAESAKRVAEINAGDRSWTAGLNELSDLSWAEFQEQMLMKPQDCSATVRGGHALVGSAPPSIDWRDYGALNKVKNQKACGSCWAFSTVGTLESHMFLKYGKMLNISEQQLVDCAGDFNNNGCNGGLPSQAFEYIHYAGGIDSEPAYPYTAKTGPACLAKQDAIVAKVMGVVNITEDGEDQLLDAVGSIGPVSIAFDVVSDFRHYSSGVYDGLKCDTPTTPDEVNHAVVAVGYGEDDGIPYFTVRNSWCGLRGRPFPLAAAIRCAHGLSLRSPLPFPPPFLSHTQGANRGATVVTSRSSGARTSAASQTALPTPWCDALAPRPETSTPARSWAARPWTSSRAGRGDMRRPWLVPLAGGQTDGRDVPSEVPGGNGLPAHLESVSPSCLPGPPATWLKTWTVHTSIPHWSPDVQALGRARVQTIRRRGPPGSPRGGRSRDRDLSRCDPGNACGPVPRDLGRSWCACARDSVQ